MTKTYLISEEVLQEVLNAIDSCTACFIENDISWNGAVDDATNALRKILASPPAEPFCYMGETWICSPYSERTCDD